MRSRRLRLPARATRRRGRRRPATRCCPPRPSLPRLPRPPPRQARGSPSGSWRSVPGALSAGDPKVPRLPGRADPRHPQRRQEKRMIDIKAVEQKAREKIAKEQSDAAVSKLEAKLRQIAQAERVLANLRLEYDAIVRDLGSNA
ncbi:hypothetical protein D7006_14405 [Xanthobacter sp. YC-JY1]|nr:hypothetical protein D7006_14405 [Xanthobacter sp. YC-JY1]